MKLTRASSILLVAALSSATANAQWLKHPDPRVPRQADGRPDLSAPAPRTSDGRPDLSGLWTTFDGRFVNSLEKPDGLVVPFQPWAERVYKERLANDARDWPSGFCLPHSVPDAMLIPGSPWKLVQTPGLVIVLYENLTQFRQIFTDGRALPVEPTPTWFGYSIGKWDGDAFVVETAGFNDRSWLDHSGHPHSEALRVTERFQRRDLGHLQAQFTIDDPKAYTKPWSVTVTFVLQPDDELLESICDNEKDVAHLVAK